MTTATRSHSLRIRGIVHISHAICRGMMMVMMTMMNRCYGYQRIFPRRTRRSRPIFRSAVFAMRRRTWTSWSAASTTDRFRYGISAVERCPPSARYWLTATATRHTRCSGYSPRPTLSSSRLPPTAKCCGGTIASWRNPSNRCGLIRPRSRREPSPKEVFVWTSNPQWHVPFLMLLSFRIGL